MHSKRADISSTDGDRSAPRFEPLGQAWRDRVRSSAPDRRPASEYEPSGPKRESGGSEQDSALSAPDARQSHQTDIEESQMDHDATTETGADRRTSEDRWRAAGGSDGGAGERNGAGADDFGEQAELRRALDLLDELMELDPEKLSLYRRRAEYARRLGDEEALLDAYLRWAEVLERRGSWRSAHLLCQQAAALRPESDRAARALERLESEQGAEMGVSLPGRSGWSEAWRDRAGSDSGLASVIWPELRRALEEVNWLQAAALRMLPDQGAPGGGDAAEREAAEILGRYFVTREEYRRAVDVLAPVVDGRDGPDEDRLDALYLKGLAHLRTDEGDRAEEYFRRVAREDEEFRSVAGWFAPGLEEA